LPTTRNRVPSTPHQLYTLTKHPIVNAQFALGELGMEEGVLRVVDVVAGAMLVQVVHDMPRGKLAPKCAGLVDQRYPIVDPPASASKG
jgi:hypothetical protein